MKLFVIYIGGSHDQSLIELHYMRFVIADKIENTYPSLKKSWWGRPESLHLDAWGELHYADGYAIELDTTPPKDPSLKLYFVNLGGYDTTQFTELHKNIFVVASSDAEAKAKAVAQIQDWHSPHRDYQYELENLVDVSQLANGQKFYVHLRPSEQEERFEFVTKYTPIGKNN